MMTSQLAHVTTGYLSYGLVIENGWVVDTPPAGRWLRGREWAEALRLIYLRWPHAVVGMTGCSPFADLWEAAQQADRTGPLISAQYSGRCRTCTGRWEPGDGICFDEDEGAWICENCAGQQS